MPRVRVVVLNWNSSWMTRACLRSLVLTEYPEEKLEIVVVDNASHDGSLEQVRAEFPDVKIMQNPTNLGFAEACNIGMRDCSSYDYVALVNNDAVVEPDWLQPLVDALEENPKAGAAAPLLLLDPPMAKVAIDTNTRMEIESIELDGEDITNRTHYRGVEEVGDPAWPFRLTRHISGPATLYFPAPRIEAGANQPMVTMRLRGDGNLRVDSESMHLDISAQGATRVMFAAPEERTTLVNGLGTTLNDVGEAADIGYGEELEHFDAPAFFSSSGDIGVCGGGVLFRSTMLNEVGLFDPKLFAYYEDIDLSWRARNAGWQVVAAPESRIHHQFGGSAGSTSPMFFHLYYRNWLITVLRNAPVTLVQAAFTHFARRYWWGVKYNILSAVRHPKRFSLELPKAWTSVAIGVLVLAPKTIGQRLFAPLRNRIGRRYTSKVYSLGQPHSQSRAPKQRVGGPHVLHVVLGPLSDFAELDPSDAALIRAALGDPDLDVIVVEPVPNRTDTFRLLTPKQWAQLLGIPESNLRIDIAEEQRLATGISSGERPLTLDQLRQLINK